LRRASRPLRSPPIRPNSGPGDDFAKAERLGIEFGEDFRLLEDIGWEPEHDHATVALTMQPHDLMELLRRL
jgi:hypothetical protein